MARLMSLADDPNASAIIDAALSALTSFRSQRFMQPGGIAMNSDTHRRLLRDSGLYRNQAIDYRLAAAYDQGTLFGMPMIISPVIPSGAVYVLSSGIVNDIRRGYISNLDSWDDMQPPEAVAGLISSGVMSPNEARALMRRDIRGIYGFSGSLLEREPDDAPDDPPEDFEPTRRRLNLAIEWPPAALGGEPAVKDIVDEIDQLVDEQLTHESSGYDHNINQQQCSYCREPWHGLAITRRMREMRMLPPQLQDIALAEYNYADDTSEIICPGGNT